jgi:hypothetical protein
VFSNLHKALKNGVNRTVRRLDEQGRSNPDQTERQPPRYLA